MAAIGLMMAVNANAQYLNDSGTPFEKGKFYVSASFSGSMLYYSKASDLSLTITGRGGYFIIDNLMAIGELTYQNMNKGDMVGAEIGAGARWYFDQIGIYVGGVARYHHDKMDGETYDDFVPELHAGYAFFLGRHVTLEPEVYYMHCFKENDNSQFGVRLGIGIYF